MTKTREMAPSPVLTPREAARFLGVHPNTLRRWSDAGLLEAYRVGIAGHRRFKRADLLAYLERTIR